MLKLVELFAKANTRFSISLNHLAHLGGLTKCCQDPGEREPTETALILQPPAGPLGTINNRNVLAQVFAA
jgi:hypothetical protein